VQDKELVTQFQYGDFSAFWLLYERYIDAIYAFVYRKTSEKEIAEDLTSEIWIKVMKKLATYNEQEGASFKSWLYTVAGNTVIDYYRTKKEVIDVEEIAEIGFSEDFAKNFDDKEKLAEVQAFLWTLKPIEREVIILRVWDDLSYKEIAEITGKTQDNCKQIYKRSLEKIHGNISLLLLVLFFL
jgi:RNA polymerase sigma factor (sigma-70 family)